MIAFLPDTKTLAEQLYPFTAVRQCKELRLGMLTIAQKWEYFLQQYLENLSPDDRDSTFQTIRTGLPAIPGNWLPTTHLVEALLKGNALQPDKVLEYPWQIFQWNDAMIRMDFHLLTKNRYSHPAPETVQVIHPRDVFIEEGASLSHCILNAATGPIYISRNSEIMEGTFIRGPFSLGEGSRVKLGSHIYGATSVGPYCVVGGEIKNSVLFGYSNKAHDGYLGDSVIGEWCNLGAGTTVSNLRNTAGTVRAWTVATQEFTEVGPKCGLLMGDYSRSAILTAFNTATVVGICAHVFGKGLTPKYIRDFSWGMDGNDRYEWEKAVRDVGNWKKLKGYQLHEEEIHLLKSIFDRCIM